MKRHTHKGIVLQAEDKFNLNREPPSSPENLSELGDLAIKLLNDKKLQVSKVRPFFWSLVETYVDRFRCYPFDVKKALFSHLEINDYQEAEVLEIIKQLELRYEEVHGRGIRKSTQLLSKRDSLNDEIKDLRDCLRYAAMVSDAVVPKK